MLSQRFRVAGAAGLLPGVPGVFAVCPESPLQEAIAKLEVRSLESKLIYA